MWRDCGKAGDYRLVTLSWFFAENGIVARGFPEVFPEASPHGSDRLFSTALTLGAIGIAYHQMAARAATGVTPETIR